jgi:hypothetical protein
MGGIQSMASVHQRAPLLALAISACAVTTAPAFGGQPPDVVVSDSNGNTAMGSASLHSNSSGVDNTSSGDQALYNNTSGCHNVAFGSDALYSNTTGSYNTASGYGALEDNTVGQYNTATGYTALDHNTSGSENTASGYWSLYSNTTGSYNTAVGTSALSANTTGADNTASGYLALNHNTYGQQNTATGMSVLLSNTTGSYNTAAGTAAMYGNTTGNDNIAIGTDALYHNASGSYNIAIGYQAGMYATAGSSNIIIGNSGTAYDSKAIKIGTQGTQTSAHIAGIYGTPLTGSQVVVNSSGQLGVIASSERYKTAIESMGASSGRLDQLRPVTFRLKSEPNGSLQYGLIAEEVARVYPELVIRDEGGRVEGVRYDELAPMLLNELQKQRAQITALNAQLANVAVLRTELKALRAETERLIATQSMGELHTETYARAASAAPRN